MIEVVFDTKETIYAIISLCEITFHGEVLNKLVKYMLIAFISFNVFGGTFLGLREYFQDKDAKKAFENFYDSDTQVMGAYDKKSPNYISGYMVGGATLLVVLIGSGAVYSIIKRKRLRKSKNKDSEVIL